jgi:acyl carrier protein
MTDGIHEALTETFQFIFDDPGLQITRATTADDIAAWDSLTHIDLIVTIEKRFKVRFTTGEITGLKNVGDLIDLIAKKSS